MRRRFKKRKVCCLAVLYAGLTGSGCSSVKEVPVITHEVVKEILQPFELPPDSSLITALFYCDSVNRVRIQEIEELKSNRMATSLSLSEKGRFIYKSRVERDTVYVRGKEVIRREEIPVYIDRVREVNRLTWWQKLQIWCGRILLIIISVKIIKWKYKF